MNDQHKSKEQLVAELTEMRHRVAELEEARNGVGETNSNLAPGDPQWHSLAANTPVFVVILDRDHRIRFVNHTEPGESPDEVIGKTPYDYCLPEYHDNARRCIEQVFSTGKPTSYETEAARPNNERVWYQAYLGPIFDKGEVVAVSLIAENITARKQVEQERDRTHAILNAAIECLPFDFFALDSDGRYMLANAAARMPYGDIVGKTPEEVCPNERDLALWLENNRRAFAGERVEGEVELAVHGENRHYHNIITPIRDGDTSYGILGVNVDITERKRMEDDLRHREEQYRGIVETTTDGLAIVREDGTLAEVNPALCSMHGYSRDELLNAAAQKVIQPDSYTLFEEFVRSTKEGRAFYCEAKDVRKDGTSFDIEVRGAPFKFRGQPHLLAVLRDISGRKKAERSLRESEEQFRRLFDDARDGILLANPETKQLGMANRAICTMLGYSKEEFEQLYVHDIHPEVDLLHAVEQFEKLARGDLTVYAAS